MCSERNEGCLLGITKLESYQATGSYGQVGLVLNAFCSSTVECFVKAFMFHTTLCKNF